MPVDENVRYGRLETPLERRSGGDLTEDERSFGALCHFLGVVGIFGPLICWLMRKDSSRWIDEQGKQAVNFHLTMIILWFICCITVIGVVLMPVIIACNLIFSILAGMKVKEGQSYQYPINFNLIK